jgi:hypothetical protein
MINGSASLQPHRTQFISWHGAIAPRMEDEFQVAFHESFHAAVAHDIGATVRNLSLEATTHTDGTCSWDGNAQIDSPEVGPDGVASIAVAGPIADIKYALANALRRTYSLDEDTAFTETTIDLDCVKAIASSLAVIRDQADPKNMNVNVAAVCREHSAKKCVFLGDCCGDASAALSAIPDNQSQLESVITLVVEKVNSSQHSAKTLAIARQLMSARPHEVTRKTIGDQRLRQLLDDSEP